MCLLRDKLELDRRESRSTFEIAEPIKALLKACYDSAHKSLRILATLQTQDLLGMECLPHVNYNWLKLTLPRTLSTIRFGSHIFSRFCSRSYLYRPAILRRHVRLVFRRDNKHSRYINCWW